MSTSKDVTDAYGDSAPHPRTGSAGLPPAAIVEVEAYTNKCENSGMCLIFNNKVFDKPLSHTRSNHAPFHRQCTGQSTRDGTDVDADKIEKTFMRLGYSVTRADSYSRMEMNVALKQGHFSWRNNVDGSWFIQALCRVFERLCRPPSGCGQANDVQGPSLTQILTIATRVVAYDYESCTDQEFTDHMKQMPCVLSMLSKEVYFRPNF